MSGQLSTTEKVTSVLVQMGKVDDPAVLALSTPLFGDGLGLDSLDTAELSAHLEDLFGHDPFSEGHMPVSLGELVDFYGSTSAPAPTAT